MKNLVQDGDVLTLVAPADVKSGDFVLIGTIGGVATRDALSGAAMELRVEGVVEIKKDTNLAISAGDRVFWVPASSWVNKTATSQVCVGRAVAAAGTTDVTVKVLLGPATPSGT